ncbi:hypothetical protein AHAS_Ahas06G0143700 [Arachis hypogaea]
MPRVGHAASTLQRADCPIPPPSGSSDPTSSSLRPFHPPRTEPLPAPRASMNDVQNSEPDAEEVDPADEVDSFDEHVDTLLAAQDAQKRKGRKTTELWDVKTIESDSTIKQVKLSVKEAMKPPNGRKVVLKFNNALQPVEDEAGLLSGVMGLLGSDYTKFPICKRDWRERFAPGTSLILMLQEMFHFEEDSRGIIKGTDYTITAMTQNFHLHQILKTVQMELLQTIGKGFSIIATAKRHRISVRKMPRIDQSSFTPTPVDRKAWIVSRGELYLLTHKKTNGSYIHDAAHAIGERIEAIEQGDESSRLLSQNDSLAQALGKERPGRVRGMGLGPTSSQVFGMNSHQPSNGFEREETQRVLLELQAELAVEKLKRKAVEDEVAAEKTKRQAVEENQKTGSGG